MADLLTPAEIIQTLGNAGFVFRTACNCGGTYKEKFRRRDGIEISIAPKRKTFKVRGQEIFGTLDQIADKIKSIE